MSVEPKRECGYRKVGGLYLMGDSMSFEHCPRIPFNLHVCPVCSAGIKFAMGFTWINPSKLFGNAENPHKPECYMCEPPNTQQGLMWVGNQFYSPDKFVEESRSMGISKRIAAVPKGFEIGRHIIYLAHNKAGEETVTDESSPMWGRKIPVPAIFMVFMPTRVEKVITESMATHQEVESLKKRGITPVIVPDDDKDHQGTVYDKKPKQTVKKTNIMRNIPDLKHEIEEMEKVAKSDTADSKQKKKALKGIKIRRWCVLYLETSPKEENIRAMLDASLKKLENIDNGFEDWLTNDRGIKDITKLSNPVITVHRNQYYKLLDRKSVTVQINNLKFVLDI